MSPTSTGVIAAAQTAAALLSERVPLAIALALAAFLVLFTALEGCARRGLLSPEATRKLLHTGSGLLTLSFPFVFHDFWPVLLLTSASAGLLAIVRFVPLVRGRLAGVTTRVGRVSLGELYFPLSVALLFWLTLGRDPLLFIIPILVLTLADATGALVGVRYGLTRYSGTSKSLEGSVAFAAVAFLCIHVPLLARSDVGRVESLLIAATLALLVMLLEGSAWRGLDNLFIPIGGYVLLRSYLGLDATALAARFAVTSGLVALIVFYRMRTTLEDDSLVAGAFFCYVAWATMGWQWLVAPLAVLAGHSRLSPPTADNSRRMHGVPVVFSIWLAAAVGWLVLARITGRSEPLFPYTVVFAAHLAMFGFSPARTPVSSSQARRPVLSRGGCILRDCNFAVCDRRQFQRGQCADGVGGCRNDRVRHAGVCRDAARSSRAAHSRSLALSGQRGGCRPRPRLGWREYGGRLASPNKSW